MHTKKDAAFLINVVLSMLILAYITFITVYEQILSQNNGFFNVIVYGVVLILVFIFITLFLRVLSIKSQADETSPVLRVLIILGIIAIFALFMFMRLRYTSSISPTESPLYKTAVYLTDNQLAEAKDIRAHLLSYPADFIYGFVVSKIFALSSADASVYILVNIGMMLILAIFLFLTVYLLAGTACATLALFIMLFMPNNAYLVYSYNSELFVSALFIMALYLFEILIYKRFKNPGNARAVALICGFICGIALSCEPVLILAFLVLTAWMFSAKRQSLSCVLIPIIVSIVVSIGSLLLKSMVMGVGFVDAIKGYALCFVPTHIRGDVANEFDIATMFSSLTDRLNDPSRFLNDNSYFLTDNRGGIIGPDQVLWLGIVNQFIYLFILILCVMCVVYILRVTYDKELPLLSTMIALFIGQVLGGSNQVSYVYFVVLIIIIGSTTIHYMYLNHHPKYALEVTNNEIRKENELVSEEETEETEEDEEVKSEYMLRARALVFVGEDEGLYKQIKAEEKEQRANSDVAAKVIKTQINESGEYDSSEETLDYLDEPDVVQEVKLVHEVVAIPPTRPVEVVKPILADDYAENSSESFSNESDFSESIENIPAMTPLVKDTEESEFVVSSANEDYLDDEYTDYFDEPDEIRSPEPELKEPLNNSKPTNADNIQPEGFVFRKKEPKTEDAASLARPVRAAKPEKTAKNEKVDNAEKPSKLGKEDKKALKEAKKAEKIAEKEAKKLQKTSGKEDKKDIDKSTVKERKSLKEIKPGEPLPNPLKGPKPSDKNPVGFDFDSTDGDDFDF